VHPCSLIGTAKVTIVNRHIPSQTQAPKRIIAPLRRSDRTNESSRPFVDPVSKTNHRAPSQTQAPKQTHALVNRPAHWDQPTQPWCTPISWSLHTWDSPLAHLHAQGTHLPNLVARETLSFLSLRTWVRVSAPT
jgi:hypothetical protein